MSEKPPTIEDNKKDEQEISPEEEKEMISMIKKKLEKMGAKEEVDYSKPPTTK